MAEGVVDAFEVIEVEAQHRDDLAALHPLELVLQLLTQQHAIGQIGQSIVARHVRNLLLGAPALGDVLMGRNPAAVGQRLVDHREGAAVIQRYDIGERAARGDFGPQFGKMLGGIAGKRPRAQALSQNVVKVTSRLGELGRQAVHLDIAAITEDQLGLRIEHRHALRHVVENGKQEPLILQNRSVWSATIGSVRERQYVGIRQRRLFQPHGDSSKSLLRPSPNIPPSAGVLRTVQWSLSFFNQVRERALSPGFVWISLAIIEERKSASGQKKRPPNRAASTAPVDRRLLFQCARNAAEGRLQLRTEALNDRDNGDGDAGRDQAIFDSRGPGLVFQETRKGQHSGLQLWVCTVRLWRGSRCRRLNIFHAIWGSSNIQIRTKPSQSGQKPAYHQTDPWPPVARLCPPNPLYRPGGLLERQATPALRLAIKASTSGRPMAGATRSFSRGIASLFPPRPR